MPGPNRAELLEQNRRLQEEVSALRRPLRQAVVLDQGKQERLAVTTSAMGLSLNQIREVFALLLDQGKGKVPGRATLGRWVRQHARPAAKDLCADEIFFHGKPVLVGVEPFSMALLLCRRGADRTGAICHEALKPFTALEYVACDQGKGLLAGLKALGQDRHQAGGALPEVGLDIFQTDQIAQACRLLPGPAWRKVRALLGDDRALTFLDRLHRRLAQAEPRQQLREALVQLWRLERGPRTGAGMGAAVAQRVLCAKLAGDGGRHTRGWRRCWGR